MGIMIPALWFFFAITTMGFAEEFDFADGNRKFSAAIYKTIAKDSKDSNFLVSPLSAEATIALAYAGAKNETAEEISRGLFFPNDREKVYALFKQVQPLFRSTEYYNLSIANKIFLRNDYEISEEYRKVAVEVFDADVENVDFDKPKEVADHINEFVENRTNHKIVDLVSDQDVTERTRLFLVNALYFGAKWQSPFNTRDTAKKPFYRSAKEASDVDTMEISDYFRYYECSKLNAKFLQMPYEGEDISMVLVLPNEVEGLAALEARAEEIFQNRNYTVEYVAVSLPKFTVESRVDLKAVLQTMGVKKPFEEDFADFSGITKKESLFISKAIQKTFINVTEDGTEAAAATFVEVTDRLFNDPTSSQKFHADHPFLFAILYRNKVIFMGRYVSPVPVAV